MFATAALTIAAAVLQGDAGRDLTRLVPIYAEPAAFVSKPGERIRLGAYMPPKDRLQDLTALGVNLFVGETDRLAPPDQGAGPFSLENLKAQQAAAQEAGAKWGLDLYSTFPTFDESTVIGEGTVEVRSKERIPAFSPWNPERIRFTANRYGRVNRAFEKLAFVSAGMFGEFGDASMFSGVTAYSPELALRWENALKVDAPKPGFWSGDPLAMDSWKRTLESRHGDIAKAYAAWGMTPPEGDATPVPLDASFPYIARLEYQDWYRSALPQMATALADIGSNIFKGLPVVIPLGPPNDLPELGLDIFRVVDAATPNAAAVKVTNLGTYGFAENWAISLGRIRGAARTADVPLIAASPFGTPEEFSERMFEAIALGASAIIDAPNALLSNQRNLAELSSGMVHVLPRTDVVVLYPTSTHVLNPGRSVPPATYRGAVELRDYADFDILEESAVAKNGLAPYRVAVVFEGSIWRQQTLEALRTWVQDGGTVIAYDFGKMADPRGNTAIYQELFGFATALPAPPDSLRWLGDVPATYRIDIGASEDERFLLTGWGEADGTSRRALPGATLRLPIKVAQAVVTVTLAKAPAGGRVEFRSNGKLLAGVDSDGGVKQVQFTIDSGEARNGVLSITAGGFDPASDVRIDSIDVVGPESTEPLKLTGEFEAPVTIENVRSWTKPIGKGLAIFVPVRQQSREQFMSAVRLAIFSLSKIVDGRSDAPEIDNKADAMFLVDLGERLAIYNSNSADKVWSEQGMNVPAKSTRFYELQPQEPPIVVQAEAFATESAPRAESPAASPGTGASAVRVGENTAFELVVSVPETRTYRIYARTLRNGQLSAARFKIGEVESAPVAVGAGDVYLVGEFTLEEGDNRVQMISDKTFLADLIVATSEPGAVSFRFARKT